MAGTRADDAGSGGGEVLAESAVAAARDLRVVFSRLRRRMREVADTDGELSPSQTSVLTRLAKEGAWTASGLAIAERVRPQSMAATIAALDTHKLIRRDPDPTDGRRQLITLTDAGRRRAEGDKAARVEWLTRAMHDHYTEAERQTLLEAMTLLDRLTHL
ncbi:MULTISPECIES: MarR family winged helix-turn-helix transcriptional regulator [Pseudofrankia]|uniref:MarR family winged helix-turn-helix transcriptional regulator n=1 Tax=Pseudofrankia TaxID=2994363 RepID=UPI000234DBDB|nr:MULTISPECIES: MarR family transcriptional regulator [Pseudofrankia]OHV35159.1 MarR family transcriptional regulator [Pseudofrankia sp. EUN1h]